MKSLFFIMLMSLAVQAQTITGIVDVWEPEAGQDAYLVLAADRFIYEIPASKTDLVIKAYSAKEAQTLVEIHTTTDEFADEILGQRAYIKDISLMSKSFLPSEEEESIQLKAAHLMDNYKPTIVDSLATAQTYFNSMRRDTRGKSQCYNRAHVWAFELWKRYRVNSNKTWIFFTRQYINRTKWKWWFHVSPSVTVAGQKEEVVLDRKFRRAPSLLTDWKNEFMKNKAHCPMIERYTQYSQNQYSNDCYLIITSMHFWQPYHIENLELGKGEIPTGRWVEYQLDRAYKNGISWMHGGVSADDLY